MGQFALPMFEGTSDVMLIEISKFVVVEEMDHHAQMNKIYHTPHLDVWYKVLVLGCAWTWCSFPRQLTEINTQPKAKHYVSLPHISSLQMYDMLHYIGFKFNVGSRCIPVMTNPDNDS